MLYGLGGMFEIENIYSATRSAKRVVLNVLLPDLVVNVPM